MADIKFSCPKCGQAMEAHEQWGGEKTQCPSCKAEITIPEAASNRPKTAPKLPTVPTPVQLNAPPAPAAPAAPRATHEAPPPPAPPAETKLKFVAHTPPERTAAPPPQTKFAAAQNQAKAQAKKSKVMGGLVKALVSVVVLAALGVGGYFGYGWYKDRQARKQAAAAPPVAAQTNAPAVDPNAQPAPASIEPVWTLDLDAAIIPDGLAAGSIAGTNFALAAAPLYFTENGPVLSLRSDKEGVPDRQILVYLRTKPGENLEGRDWTVTTNMRGAEVPLVIRSAKPGPQLKNFTYGYAMKLELGQVNGGVLPGKIFISLPDAEQTVVAGKFNVNTNVASAK